MTKAACEEVFQALVGIADAWPGSRQVYPFVCDITCFFQQFALRGEQNVFAMVYLACGDFDELPLRCIAILAFHDQLAVIQQRQDGYRAGMGDVFTRADAAIRHACIIFAHLEKIAVV